MNFFYRHLITFMAPLLLALTLMGGLSVYVAQTFIKREINQSTLNMLRQTKENIELILGESDPMFLIYGSNPKVLQSLGSILRNRTLSQNELIAFDIMDGFISAPADARPYIESFYVYLPNDNGRFLSSSDGISSLLTFYDTDWHREYLMKDADVKEWIEPRTVRPYTFESSERNIISIFRRIDAVNGLLVLNIKPEYIENLLSSLSTLPEQTIAVVDERNRILFSDREASGLQHLDLSRLKADGDFHTLDTDEERYVITELTSSRYGWRYLSVVPERALYQVPLAIMKMTAALLIGSLLMGFAFAFYMSRKNHRQVFAIMKIIQSAEQGRPLPKIAGGSRNEYDVIIHSIVKTFLEQSYLRVQLSERRYKLQAAQMMALQSQINPHFLFNTLETLKWETIALTGAANEASEIIDHLSQMLRYSLADPSKSVTVDKEIDSLQHYVAIQKYRYEDQFDMVWDIPEEVRPLPIIKLLLQPIVENSIYHGIKESESFCRIKVKMKREGPILNISIIDNGRGMSRERLREVRAILSDESESNRIGLANTNKRIRLAYAGADGLTIRSKEGFGTAVSMALPFASFSKLLPDAPSRNR